MRVYTKVYKQFELLSVFSEKGWRESEWFCHPALRPGHVSSASIWMFPYRKTLHLKRQQDHVVSFGAWAAFYKLHKLCLFVPLIVVLQRDIIKLVC